MDKVIYYKDELNDDFAGNNIKTKDVPDNFVYIKKNPLWRVVAFLFYYVVACPLVTAYNFLFHGEVIKNRRVLKGYRKNGYYLYGNHTMIAADAFTPSRVAFPKKANVIVNPDAFSIPVVSAMVGMLGGVPIGTNLRGMKKFTAAMTKYSESKKVMMIYPEAHIWPYYTGIRPFKDVSFKYPAKDGRPVFCFTRIFKKRKFFRRPRVVVYIDGPFFPKDGATVKENQKYLRDCVYEAMKKRALKNEIEYVKYVRQTENEQPGQEFIASVAACAEPTSAIVTSATATREDIAVTSATAETNTVAIADDINVMNAAVAAGTAGKVKIAE